MDDDKTERDARATPQDPIEALALHIADSALDTKALDLAILDVRGVVSYADFFVVCSGRSDRQCKAIANNVRDELAKVGYKPIGVEGLNKATWVVLDYGDVVVHIFHHNERDHYGLDRLWSDVPRMPMEIPPELLTENNEVIYDS